MNKASQTLLKIDNVKVVDQIDLAARMERRRPTPTAYHGGIADALLGSASHKTLWNHQSLALEQIEEGHDVVVSTSTASGKSLVFQAPVIRYLAQAGRALIFYPTKALAADQRVRWDRVAKNAGWPIEAVTEIHGDIPTANRMEALRTARLVIATPDAIHAWLLRNLSSERVQAFLADLRFVIIDEAHVCEGIFGTNCAYFFRRLEAAHRELLARNSPKMKRPYQIIATTATIEDPCGHLNRLTGRSFSSVGEADDGSPSQARAILHIEGPESGAAGEAMLVETLSALAEHIAPNAFIAFHDSRQGVERIAHRIDREDVLAYRSGYEARDRARIERALRAGKLRGVIATSALELGIDIPQFTVGLNLGIPQSKKAFRQRLGRIGRASPSAFAIIAPPPAFRQFGSSLREYYESSVEPSYLYLSNRFVQFAQARCFALEREALECGTDLPDVILWPDGFADSVSIAKLGSRRPREFDAIAAIGADNPHLNYPLRQICEAEYGLHGAGGSSERIGTIQLQQAIREAYPGATYLHLREPRQVAGWRSTRYERTIRLKPAATAQRTLPMLIKTVNASTAREDLIESHLRAGSEGLIAEVMLQVNESVEGYSIGSTKFPYRELRKTDPNMARKQRDFSTTGIILRIDQPWFNGPTDAHQKVRRSVARALKQMLQRERSIAPTDIDFADSNIALFEAAGPRKAHDAIVVYDSVYGGLRLTEGLFTHFEEFCERLVRAAETAGDDAFVSKATAERLLTWHRSLTENVPCLARANALPTSDNEYLIYAPESEVGIRIRGELIERTLLGPELFNVAGTDMLMYRHEAAPGLKAWCSHDQIEPVGQNWRRALWSATTKNISELAA